MSPIRNISTWALWALAGLGSSLLFAGRVVATPFANEHGPMARDVAVTIDRVMARDDGGVDIVVKLVLAGEQILVMLDIPEGHSYTRVVALTRHGQLLVVSARVTRPGGISGIIIIGIDVSGVGPNPVGVPQKH